MVWRSNHENTDSIQDALTWTYENQDYQSNMPLPEQPLQHQSLRDLTHEHEAAVESSIALKYEGPKRVKFFQRPRRLTPNTN